MKWGKFLPYLLIAFIFSLFLLVGHPEVFNYKQSPTLTGRYLRSQDIEDPQGKIKDRVILSDSDIYIASGSLYAAGEDPTKYNFQHPPFVKYLFGFSALLTDNPFYIQIFFGFILLCLTYFLGTKIFKNRLVAGLATFLLLIDPVFGGLMNQALLDLGQAVFALTYVISVFFFPGSWLFQGLALGLFAASKFWSTAIIFVSLAVGYHFLVKKGLSLSRQELGNYLKSGVVAFMVFALTYSVSFIKSGGAFNIFAFLAKDLRFMFSHNSANTLGGPIILFVTGYFAPWWFTPPVLGGAGSFLRAADWSLLWPVGLILGVVGALKEFRKKTKNTTLFVYLFPLVYLLLESTQVPFTRYFIIILPFVYLSFANLVLGWYHSSHVTGKTYRS